MTSVTDDEGFKAPNPSSMPRITDCQLADSKEDKQEDSAQTERMDTTSEERAEEEQKEEMEEANEKEEEGELKNENQVVLPAGIAYSVPAWSGLCTAGPFALEVLKNGVIIDTLDLCSRPLHILGRLPVCHITMEHPSLSRYHAVLQYNAHPNLSDRPVGWYLFDLDSTHGTWVNKVKIRPMEFHRVRVGHVLKFGGSSRLYIMQGPSADREDEAALSYSQLKAQRDKARAEAEALREAQTAAAEKKRQEAANRALVQNSCSWGFGEDAEEEAEAEEVGCLLAEPQHEEKYRGDPKRALRAYFEREGFEAPEFEFLDAGFNKHHVRVELTPLQGSGRPTYAEAVISGGKKKEAVVACALEACRLLDRMGELYKAATSRAARRRRDWEANEFYDSDEDTFLDRTGDIERKRAKRMAIAGKLVEEAEAEEKASDSRPDTFESLNAQWAKLMADIHEVETKLNNAKKELAGGERPAESELDALDAYMAAIKAGALDRRSRMALRLQLTQMRQQKEVLRKRLQSAAPSLSLLAMRQEALAKAGAAKKNGEEGREKKKEEKDKKEEKEKMEEEKEEKMEEEKEEKRDSGKDISANAPKPVTGKMRFSVRATGAGRRPRPFAAPVNLAGADNAQPEEEEEEEEELSEEKEGELAEATAREKEGERGEEAQAAVNIGPQKPDTFPSPKEPSDVNEEEVVKKRRRRPRKPAVREVKEEEEEPQASADPDYVCWVPPSDQTGDGKTSLNEKFGY